MFSRRTALIWLSMGVIAAPFVVRNSGVLMPIANHSLVFYELRGEKLAPGGGPLPADSDWLQTMRISVPQEEAIRDDWSPSRAKHFSKKLFDIAKRKRPDVYWSAWEPQCAV